MKYKGDITNPEVMVQYQGDRVLVHKAGVPDKVLTLVRVMDVNNQQQMRLCNREDKTRKPDWPLTQALWKAMLPANPNKDGCKWELAVV